MAAHIHWERRGVLVQYSGTMVFSDLLNSVLTIHSDPRYTDLRYVIHLIQPDLFDDSFMNLPRLAGQVRGARHTNSKVKFAVVSQDLQIVNAVSKTFSALADLPVAHFRTLAEARAWLGPVADQMPGDLVP